VLLKAWIEQAEGRLGTGPHPDRARRDAETLLLYVIERDRVYLFSHSEAELSAEQVICSNRLLDRRLSGEPIQYIIGECEFFGLPFRVTHDVLIPRPETEHLVERALELAANFTAPHIVDVGTGSGAIAVALAHKLPSASITAIDQSKAALAIARENAEQNGVAACIRFLDGDLLSPVYAEQFSIIVSNPPYVAERDRNTLTVEVRDYEPAMALFAGDEGLDIYRRLIPAAHAILVRGGFLALEIGYGQAEPVTALLAEAGFQQIERTADLQGIPRVVTARR
jgi:release factor glutamine methyltransferase